jgi:exportin-7
MDQAQLVKFESYCADLYSSSSPQARKTAHDILMPLLSQPETITQLEFALANTANPHAILFAANGLIQLITNFWPSLTEQFKEDLRKFLLSYLSQRCVEMYSNPLSEQAMSFMIRLLCRLVKLSWLDGPKNQTITDDVQTLIDPGSIAQAILAVDIYTTLTVEMQPTKGPQMSRYRRTAMSFRDISLASIFQTGMKILQNLVQGKLAIPDKAEEARLVHKVLKLVQGSLSFDFMGTMPDETADDQSTVMVPYTWTNVKDLSYPGLFFDLYQACATSGRRACAVLCLQNLVLFASLRRSLYSKEEERAAMLSIYMQGTRKVLEVGLDSEECYHEFCRLLGRVNAANQLTELSSNPEFEKWIDEMSAFTASALARIDKLPNSVHYLLGFWTVLVPSVTSLGTKAPAKLVKYMEQLLVMYLESRLKLSAAIDDIDATDPLEDESMLFEQLDVVTALSKLFVDSSLTLVIKAHESARDERSIIWVVYLMGAIMAGQIDRLTPPRGRSVSVDGSDDDSHMRVVNPTPGISKEYQAVGEMAKRVFTLMARTDEQPSSAVSEQLELAYLYFIDQFKKVYLAEQAKIVALITPRTEGPSRLCQAVGLSSEAALIDLFVSKIFKNFQRRASMENVLKKTLGFANDLLAGTSAVFIEGERGSSSLASALANNEHMRYVLSHPEAIDFGRVDKNYNTVYYSLIFRLIFSEKLSVDWSYFNSLFARISMGTKTPEQAKVIVMLARNLKGVCLAATSAEHYNVVFKYLVENPKNVNQCKIGLFSAAADVWWDEPEVVVPVLKFIAEFAHNKAQRIVFEANSPNGIVLFREATKVLSAYGQRMLQRPASFAYKDIYEEKYKGIGAALSLLTNTLGGNYANLGVFELYGDNTLQVAMGTALALCLSVPLNDLSAFLKSLKPVYTFLEIVTKSHMSAMVTLSTSQFSTILRALEDGLTAFDTAVALSACTAMDHICTYLLETKDGAEEVAAIQAHLASVEVKNALSRQLAILNHLSTSGEFASTWSLSRPFLGLILLEKNAFLELRQSVVQQQLNAERRQLVENAYNELMQGVNDNMSTKNRELFTKNLYQFGITLRSK